MISRPGRRKSSIYHYKQIPRQRLLQAAWRLAFDVLGLAEQGFALVVAGQRFAHVCQYLHTALHGRALANRVKPLFRCG